MQDGQRSFWQSLSPASPGLIVHLVTLWRCPLPASPGRGCLNYFAFPTWLQRGVAEGILSNRPESLKGCNSACPACPAPARLDPRCSWVFLVCRR